MHNRVSCAVVSVVAADGIGGRKLVNSVRFWYVDVIRGNGDMRTTKTAAGSKPVWNESFTFSEVDKGTVEIALMQARARAVGVGWNNGGGGGCCFPGCDGLFWAVLVKEKSFEGWWFRRLAQVPTGVCCGHVQATEVGRGRIKARPAGSFPHAPTFPLRRCSEFAFLTAALWHSVDSSELISESTALLCPCAPCSWTGWAATAPTPSG